MYLVIFLFIKLDKIKIRKIEKIKNHEIIKFTSNNVQLFNLY